MKRSVVVEDAALNTPFGTSIPEVFSKLAEKRTAFKTIGRFKTDSFLNDVSAEIRVNECSEESIIWQIIKPLREKIISWNADYLLLATTKGEVDLLEKECRSNDEFDYSLPGFLARSLEYFNISDGMLVSAACASPPSRSRSRNRPAGLSRGTPCPASSSSGRRSGTRCAREAGGGRRRRPGAASGGPPPPS